MDFLLREVHEELKGFVRKREKPEGSMGKGYISYEPLYYASEYIKRNNSTPGATIWDEDKGEGEILEENGKRWMIKSKCKLIICQITTR